MDKKLQELLDKQAITEVLYKYARGWDRYDEAAIRDCFHADAQHAHGAFKGASQDFITAGLKSTKDVIAMTHMITNPMIVIQGDRAVSECSFFAHHRRMNAAGDGEEDMFLKGRYLDVLEKRLGIWRISQRTGLHDFERVVPPADQTLASAAKDQLSQRYPDDPIYALLRSL